MVNLVRQSYEALAPAAPEVIEDIYRRLFERAPETRALFTPDMNTQYGKFAAPLELCALETESPEQLRGVLGRLGARHRDRGVAARYYPHMVEAMLEAFAAQLGADWTPAHEAAWRAALRAISEEMAASDSS